MTKAGDSSELYIRSSTTNNGTVPHDNYTKVNEASFQRLIYDSNGATAIDMASNGVTVNTAKYLFSWMQRRKLHMVSRLRYTRTANVECPRLSTWGSIPKREHRSGDGD